MCYCNKQGLNLEMCGVIRFIYLLAFFSLSSVVWGDQVFSDPIYQQAYQQFSNGHFKQSHRLFKTLDERYPDHPVILNNLGVVSVKLGDVELAAKFFERAITVNEHLAISYKNLQKIYSYRAALGYRQALALTSDQKPPLEVEFISDLPSSVASSSKTVSPAQQVLADNRVEKPLVEEPDRSKRLVSDGLQKSISQFVMNWAQAWSSQDAEAYFSHYVEGYQPRPNISHESWKRRRTERVRKPAHISVEVLKLNIHENGDNYDVVFHQSYRSNFLTSLVVKRLRIRKTSQGWKIFSEKVIKRK